MRKDVGARLDVEAGGRLVEQEQLRAVQQRAGDLDAPQLAAGEMARLVARAVGEPDALRSDVCRAPRARGADAVQRAVIGEVLLDREIEVERAALEDDAETAQRLAGVARDVAAENRIAPAPACA